MPVVASVEPTTKKIAMAQIGYGEIADMLETLLGSCVGVCVWDSHTHRGALAHVLLSDSQGVKVSPAKFANTAISHLKDQLLRSGANPRCLQAKIIGGAKMFGNNTKRDVGRRNCEAVRAHLEKNKIPLIGEHTGGTKGRMIRFFLNTGEVEVISGREKVATL